MDFEWDEHKRQANILKHGIDFLDVVNVLISRPCLLKMVCRNERRFIALGELNSKVIAVIYTKRQQARRIISARRARAYEELYYRRYIGNIN